MQPTGPAYCRPAAFAAFRHELRGVGTPLGLLRAAAAISLHPEPEGGAAAVSAIDDVCRTVERLRDSVRRRLHSGSDDAALAHLHDVLFDLIGFRGAEASDYYDPQNSYVPRVLQRRRGLPIALVAIYRAVAEGVGLRVEGVNAPGHFLAAVVRSGGAAPDYVDPFHGGTLLTRGEALARVEAAVGGRLPVGGPDPLPFASPNAWLRRMLHNLQAVFSQTHRQRDMLAMQELESLLDTPRDRLA